MSLDPAGQVERHPGAEHRHEQGKANKGPVVMMVVQNGETLGQASF